MDILYFATQISLAVIVNPSCKRKISELLDDSVIIIIHLSWNFSYLTYLIMELIDGHYAYLLLMWQ